MKQLWLKAVALLLCVSLCGLFPAAAEEAQADGTPAGLAAALGVAEGMNAGGAATRADMAVLAVRALGLVGPEAGDPAAVYYKDVPAEHRAFREISLATTLGLLSGTGEGTFSPEEPVTLAQAAKILVCALGYGPAAEQRGGWPVGYLSCAKERKLLWEAAFSPDEAISAEQAVNMVERMLEADRPDGRGTLLETVFDTGKYRGVVTGTHRTALTPYTPELSAGAAAVNDKAYLAGTSGVEAMLGLEVDFYVRLGEAEPKTVLYAQPRRPQVTQIPAERIDGVSAGRTAAVLSYFESEDSTRAVSETLPFQTTALIYNGRLAPVSGDPERDLAPEEGSVRLVDSEGDGSIDYVFVEDVRTAVVESYSETQRRLYFRYAIDLGDGLTDSMAADPADAGTDVYLEQGDGTFALPELAENDVVDILRSKPDAQGRRSLTLRRSDARLETSIEAIEQGDETKLVTPEGAFELTAMYSGYLESVGRELKPGMDVTLCLNTAGKVAYLGEDVDSERVYGFLYDAAVEPGIEDTGLMRIFTQNGAFDNFALRDKVTVIRDGRNTGKHTGESVVRSLFTQWETDTVYESNFVDYANGTALTADMIGAESVEGSLAVDQMDTQNTGRMGIGSLGDTGSGSVTFRFDSGNADGFHSLAAYYTGRAIQGSSVAVYAGPTAARLERVDSIPDGMSVTERKIDLSGMAAGLDSYYLQFRLNVTGYYTWAFVEQLKVMEQRRAGADRFDPTNMQLIRFRPDRDRKIDLIEFAKPPAADAAEREADAENGVFRLGHEKQSRFYHTYSKMFIDPNKRPVFAVPPTTMCFYVPADPWADPAAARDEEGYSVGSFQRNNGDFVVESFNESLMGEAGVMVCYQQEGGRATYNYMSPYSLVENVSAEVSGGDEVVKLTAWTGGVRTEYIAEKDSGVFTDRNTGRPFKRGDVLQVGDEAAGKVQFVNAVFQYNPKAPSGFGYTYLDPAAQTLNRTDEMPAYGDYNSDLQIVSGTVTRRGDSYMEIANGDRTMLVYVTDNCPVTALSTANSGREAEKSSYAEVKKGDYVVLRLRWNMCEQMIRYTS